MYLPAVSGQLTVCSGALWFILKMEYSVSTYMVLLMWASFHFCSLSLRASASVVTCVVPSAGTCGKTSEVCSPDRQCPTYQLGSVSDKECNSRSCSDECSGNFTSIRLTNVSAQLIPYDTKFSINVSWVITNPGVCGGFEVKVTQDGGPFRCKCLRNPGANNFVMRSVDYSPAVERDLEVSVRPYPVGTYTTDPYGPFRRPHSCNDIPPLEMECDLSRYGLGRDLTVQSTVCNNTKTMEVSWASLVHSAETSVPPTCYVYLYQRGHTTPEHIFVVNNATNITVRNLNKDVRYSVELQLRGHCSSTEANYRGCGNHSSSVQEQPTQCVVPTPSTIRVPPSPTPTTIRVQPSPTPASESPSTSQAHGALWILVVIPLVVVVVVAVVFLLFKRWRRTHISHRIVSIKTHQVCIFYCPTTPQKEIAYIQEHIVCPLLEYFDVVTLNDFTSGDLPAWIQEMMQISKSVLLVSNKEFCLQWSKDEEESQDPVMNCLRYIISAAASSHSLEKFGILTVKESSKNSCIPINSYLENFPVFTLSRNKSKNEQELKDIYRFVTRIPTFQISSTGTTPTTDGPAHVAICSTE